LFLREINILNNKLARVCKKLPTTTDDINPIDDITPFDGNIYIQFQVLTRIRNLELWIRIRQRVLNPCGSGSTTLDATIEILHNRILAQHLCLCLYRLLNIDTQHQYWLSVPYVRMQWPKWILTEQTAPSRTPLVATPTFHGESEKTEVERPQLWPTI
jgi:hypothetical protein